MTNYFISLCLLVFGGLISVLFKEKQKMPVCTLFMGISAVLLAIPSFIVLSTGEDISCSVYFSHIFGSINFVIDSLSAFFIFIISLMSFIALIYANGYIKPYHGKKMNLSSHCLFLMLLIASMLGVVTVQNSLFFLVLWEIMSISSFFLVMFENNKSEVINAGIKYLIYMHISVIFIICAFALLCIKTNSYNFSDYTNILISNKHFANIIFLLSFVGFGTKAGFIPFHNWLPDAHPAAPSHISGIMSGIMIKTGIYGILRILFLITTPTKLIAYTMIIISIISALWGVLYAITQHDIKRLLAYHSLENIGIIGIGIGIGLIGVYYNSPLIALLGFSGGILHILNHSIFKMLLFFGAGNIYTKTHTRNVELLGGLIKKMPYTSLFFIIGSVAICALPPFNGFVSEFLIYAGMILGLPGVDTASFLTLVISLASLALIGTMAILCFTKVTGVMLLGSPRSEKAENITGENEKIMLLPMAVLSLLTLIIGVFPQYVVKFVINPALSLVHLEIKPEYISNIFAMCETISLLSLILIGIILMTAGLRYLINKKSRIYNTWGCGYNNPTARMQYSASSYADLFVSTLKPLFKRISHIKKPKELFPKEAYYEMKIEDLEEAYIVNPLIKLDEKFLSKFERIQNGNIQQYILFGLIFLIISLIGLFFIG